MISLAQFYKNNLGKTLGTYNGGFVGQCVSLVIQYLIQVYGVKVTSGHGNAVDFRKGGVGGNWLASLGFEWLPEGTAAKDGDILVWEDDPGSWTGVDGHIAIWYQGQIFNQNFAGNMTAHLNSMFYEGYLGKWRYAPKPAETKPIGVKDMVTTKAQLDRLYLAVLMRTRQPGEGEDVYLNKDSGWVFDDLYASKARATALKAQANEKAANVKEITTLENQITELNKKVAAAPLESVSSNSPSTGNTTDYSQQNNTILKSIQALLTKIFK